MNSINEIYEQINSCTACQLYKNRKIDYIYRGNQKAKIMFIGEAPGETEQNEGIPFVGRSGKLLDSLLEMVGLNIHEDIYITNIVKDRPPNNRKPFYDEIVRCAPFLLKEISIIKPKLIVTLGKSSGDWFNQYKKYEINHYYEDKKWLPLYHPSYLLRRRDKINEWAIALKECIKLL